MNKVFPVVAALAFGAGIMVVTMPTAIAASSTTPSTVPATHHTSAAARSSEASSATSDTAPRSATPNVSSICPEGTHYAGMVNWGGDWVPLCLPGTVARISAIFGGSR